MSTNIHEALDNLEAAVAAISASLGPGAPNNLIEAIADNIDAVRVAIETQSTAEIVAQNTNFSDLSSVIAQLQLVCISQISIQQSNIFTNTIPPSGPGGIGIPPPYPFEEITDPEPAASDRRCYLANVLVTDLRNWFERQDQLQIDELGNIAFGTLLSIYVAAAATWASESLALGTVMGASTGLIPAIVAYARENIGLVEYSDIVAAIDANYDALVCALFGEVTSPNARGAFIEVLDVAGLSVVNQGALAVAMPDEYLNFMYYKRQDDDSIEALFQLDTTADCLGCDPTCSVQIAVGTILADNGTTIESEGEDANQVGLYYSNIRFSANPDWSMCFDTFTVSNMVVTSGAVTQPPDSYGAAYRLYYNNPKNGAGDRYSSSNIPTVPVTGVRGVVVRSTTPFTIQYDRVIE